MSDILYNENGRIGEIDAPAGAREKNAGFDVGNRNDVKAKASETPSLPNPSMLATHNAAGHEFIPLHGASDIGKDGKRIGKQPLYNAWPTKAAMTLEAAVSHMQAGWNVGIRLRDTDLVIDVDPRNFETGDDPVARLWKDFALPGCPFVRTGGGGFHFYLRKPSDLEVVDKLAAYKGIEFKSKGRQVVAAGSIHPDTGRLYALDDDPIALLLSEAPEATTVLVDAIRRPISVASSGEPGEITPEKLARLLSVHNVFKYNGCHDAWLRIMMASHHGTNGEGVDEFVAWSLGDPDYADDEAVIRDKWNSLAVKPDGVKLGTLLKALADDGHGAFIEEVLRSPAIEDFPDDLPVEIVPPAFLEKAGRIESNYRNTQRAVEAGDLGVAYDELANRAVLRAERLPWTRDIGRELNDDLIRIVREWIMEQFGFEPKKDDVSDVLFALATKNTFNPVVEYLDGLVWDGVERVDGLLPAYFGSADGAYERAVGRKLMLAAVRRARRPGTKFDTVPILEGKQGSGKTSALRVLGGRWHSDAELGRLDGKDAPGILHDVWILELGELTSMGKADVDHLKAFVSRMEDRYRPPYGKTVKTYPRRCVFVGTTNSNSYLQDLTGNRRFLPVQTGAIDLEALKRDRDQLWAEAGRIEAGGESLVLPENLWSEAALRQDERLANDPWVDAVKMYLVKDESRTRYSSQELLEDALGVPCNRQNQREAKRLSAVMARLGFQHKANVRVGGLSVTGYISADDPLFGG
jgi:hypothetical protein